MFFKKRPAVDIIIPYHNCYEHLTKCIEGIYRCTPNQDFQIILVDDGSENKKYQNNFSKHKRIKFVTMPEHKGYGEAINKGLEAGKNPWVVLMHSDTFPINAYWLINLQRAMGKLKDSGVKLISSKSNSTGIAKEFDKRITNCTEDFIAEAPIPLFCGLVHRELFDKIGSIKSYKYAGYEDQELFYRMKHFGYKQAVCATSSVFHEGGVTIHSLKDSCRREIRNNESIYQKDIEVFA